MSSPLATMSSLRPPQGNATSPLQDAMMASAASVLYVLLLLPALARNQSIGYAPSYLPYGPPTTALPSGYSFGFPAVGGSYANLPPVYAPAGSLSAAPPFTASSTALAAPAGFAGFGFPSGWPARPLGPLAAALATAYPTLFAALTGPCRSWCRVPSLPLLFPPRRPVLRLLRSMLHHGDDDNVNPILRLFLPEE